HVDAFVIDHIVAFRLAWALLAIDIEQTCAHLDVVTRQSDNTLDVVRRVVARIFEDGDITSLWQAAEDTPGKWRPAQRQRIARIAIAVFRNEQIVADEQGGDHAAGGNVEWLIGDGPHHDGDDAGIDDRLDILDPGAGFALGLYLGRHMETGTRANCARIKPRG